MPKFQAFDYFNSCGIQLLTCPNYRKRLDYNAYLYAMMILLSGYLPSGSLQREVHIYLVGRSGATQCDFLTPH